MTTGIKSLTFEVTVNQGEKGDRMTPGIEAHVESIDKVYDIDGNDITKTFHEVVDALETASKKDLSSYLFEEMEKSMGV